MGFKEFVKATGLAPKSDEELDKEIEKEKKKAKSKKKREELRKLKEKNSIWRTN